MAEQLIFDWPTGVALGEEDFFTSPANANAYAMIMAPQSWPEGKLVLVGEAGAGKSHLARVFAQAHEALTVQAFDLPEDLQAHTAVVVEDADRLPRGREETLFHLHNNLRAARLPLLLTARTPPSRWALTLPDLASRMQAASIATIDTPDDALLQALLMKLFADRQLAPAPTVFAYLLPRMERSFAAAQDVVARLDAAALATQSPVTRNLARDVLDNLASEDE